MSLFKQITILLSIFILLVLGSVMYLNFKTANDFIQNQLYTTSEDTATSLGLSLSMAIPTESEDLSTMETMINAIFDRGYYESIVLTDMDGKTLIQNQNILKVKTVPKWFVDFVKLTVPTATTQISTGWNPYGILHVKLHSGHAYLQLWNTFINITQTFVFLAFSALLALYFLLKIILKSLEGVENQAKAITDNSFIIQDKIPFTTEFKNVVIGMNKMVLKVKEIFEHEALMVKKYNDLFYKDAESGLGNRKFFSLKLSSFLDAKSSESSGTIIIFQMVDFSEAKKVAGFAKLSKFISHFVSHLQESVKSINLHVIARIKDYEFALILPECDYGKSQKVVNHFLYTLDIHEISNLHSTFRVIGGASFYTENDTQKEILSRCDFTLASAKMREDNHVVFHTIEKNNPLFLLGQERWHHLVTNAIDNDGIKLALQPVKDTNDVIYHHESYLRLSDEANNIYSAGLFMPILHSLNLTDIVDKKVFEIAFELGNKNPQMHIAINIDPKFLKTSSNLIWLTHLLEKFKGKAHLSFESTNYAVFNNQLEYIAFSKLVKSYGFFFGIDNFNTENEGLNYLQEIKPNYIKADKSFFINMKEKESSSNDSLRLIANSLEIKLIATAVETQEEYDILKSIPIDLVQGSFIAKPTM